MNDPTNEDQSETETINVVPLADLTLVLLIVLMVLSPMISQSMIHVATPSVKSDKNIEQKPDDDKTKTPVNKINTAATEKNRNHFLQSAEVNNPDMLSIEQASEYLNLATQTIYGYTSRRAIPFYKPYKKVYFLKSELEEWVKQGKKPLKEIPRSNIKKTQRF